MAPLSTIDILLIVASALNIVVSGFVAAALIIVYCLKEKSPFKPVTFQCLQLFGFFTCSVAQIVISSLSGILKWDLYGLMNFGYNFVYSAALTEIDQLFALFEKRKGCCKRSKKPRKTMNGAVKFLINSIVYIIVLIVELVNIFQATSLKVYFIVQLVEMIVSLLIVVYNIALQISLITRFYGKLINMRKYWHFYFVALYSSFIWVLSNFVFKFFILAFEKASAESWSGTIRGLRVAMSFLMLGFCVLINTAELIFIIRFFKEDKGKLEIAQQSDIEIDPANRVIDPTLPQ